MAAWMIAVGVVIVVTLVVSSAVGLFWALRHHDSLDELGVKTSYNNGTLPQEKIVAYNDTKDKLREQFAKDSVGDLWMAQLPPQAKDMLKYRLMQRAISGMSVLRRVDGDARGYWKLFSKGIITSKFWNSVLEAEKLLSQEIDAIKAEALKLEPTHDPQGIISEAMQIVIRYGDKLGEQLTAEPDASKVGPEQLAAAAQAVAKAAGAMGMPMPPMGMPPAIAGGQPRLPPGPPPPQVGGSTDAYQWKQDTEEVEVSVVVPSTATKSDVKVVIQAKSLKVLHAGNVIAEGQLVAPCVPGGSTWTLSKGRVVVSLEKADPRPWPSVFVEGKN